MEDFDLSTEQMLAEVSKDVGQSVEAPAQSETAGDESTTSAESHGKQQAATQQTTQEKIAELLATDKYGKHLVEYKARGKPVRETLAEALNRASQGYDYAQLMAEFKGKEPGYQKQIEERDQKLQALQRWQDYHDYIQKNPAWGKHVEDMWNNREQYSNPNLDPNDPITKEIAGIKQALANFSNQFGEKFSKYDNLVTEQEHKKDDIAFENEVSTVKQNFKDVDFDTKDESGKSTRTYVLEHMVRAKIPSFRTAFLDLYHDQLVEMREKALQEKQAKEVQKRTKQGIIDVKSTPNGRDKSPPSNLASKSWDQVLEMALNDIGAN
jgi:hypothetical protein